MNVFSKLSKKLSSPKEPEAAKAVDEIIEEPEEEQEDVELVYDEEGYDQFGFDRDGFGRTGYDRKGLHRDATKPLDPSVALEEDILKYRRKNGFNEFQMAVYANFKDLKDNFEANREDLAELMYNVYLNDERRAVDLWKWLLKTFKSTLSNPADAYRLGSSILSNLEKKDVPLSAILKIVRENPEITLPLFKESAYVDKRYAHLLRQALLEEQYQPFEAMMALLMQNPSLGKQDALPVDKLLKIVIEDISPTDMNENIYNELTKFIKRTKPMMRKVLQSMLEDNMKYFREQAARRKAEEERNAKLDEQRRKLAEELTAQQKEAGSRLTQRTLRAQFSELKAASIANRKANPVWEGGQFADFQQLEGLMVPSPGKDYVLDNLLPDDKLELFREPFNKKDPMAIAVKDEAGNKIGYISNHANTLLALLMDNGQKVFGRIFSIGREPESDIVQVCIEIFMEDD